MLDQLSVKASTWKRIDVLKAICDLTPVQAGFDGTRWARTLEATTDQVIGEHLHLDPPATGAVRASDGRSIWLDPNTSHLTHPTVLAQEERIITFALDAQDTTPTASPTVDTDGLDVLQADAARAVAGQDRVVLVVGPAGSGKTPPWPPPTATSPTTTGPCSGSRPPPKPPACSKPRPACEPRRSPSSSTNGTARADPTPACG